jgi:hypothetical protein
VARTDVRSQGCPASVIVRSASSNNTLVCPECYRLIIGGSPILVTNRRSGSRQLVDLGERMEHLVAIKESMAKEKDETHSSSLSWKIDIDIHKYLR